MEYKEVQLLDEISEETLDYIEINDLPSHYRCYNKQFPIYIRGLNLLESEGISKLLEDASDIFGELPFLLRIYKNAIKCDYKLEDLEIYDFLVLTIFSSTLTVKNFGWTPNINCENIIPNDEGKKIEKEIEEITERLSDPELSDNEISKLEEKIKELYEKKKEIPETKYCNYLLNDTINLFNLEFDEDVYTDFNIKIDGKNIKPLLVKDIINIKNFYEKEYEYIEKLKSLPYVDDKLIEKYLVLACFFEGDIKDNLKYLITKIKKEELEKLIELEMKAKIKISPVQIQCPKCGHITKIKVDLFQIKAYP